jgi:hypothetical protein
MAPVLLLVLLALAHRGAALTIRANNACKEPVEATVMFATTNTTGCAAAYPICKGAACPAAGPENCALYFLDAEQLGDGVTELATPDTAALGAAPCARFTGLWSQESGGGRLPRPAGPDCPECHRLLDGTRCTPTEVTNSEDYDEEEAPSDEVCFRWDEVCAAPGAAEIVWEVPCRGPVAAKIQSTAAAARRGRAAAAAFAAAAMLAAMA